MIKKPSLINELFERVFVISLQDSTDRRQYVSSLLQHHGVDFEFFNATDGRAPNRVDKDSWVPGVSKSNRFMPSQRDLRSAEVGCALSHVRIYEKIIQDKIESALILEDDIDLVESSVWVLSEATKLSKWDLIYFGVRNNHLPESLAFKVKRHLYYSVMRYLRPSLRSSQFSATELSRIFPRIVSRGLLRAGCHHGAHAYAVTRNCAAKLIEENFPVRLPADLVLNELIVQGKLESYMFTTDLFTPRPEAGSTIGNPIRSISR
ncbi:MAG: glycosyltransferase family 25 protein [Phormidesmis sp.]